MKNKAKQTLQKSFSLLFHRYDSTVISMAIFKHGCRINFCPDKIWPPDIIINFSAKNSMLAGMLVLSIHRSESKY